MWYEGAQVGIGRRHWHLVALLLGLSNGRDRCSLHRSSQVEFGATRSRSSNCRTNPLPIENLERRRIKDNKFKRWNGIAQKLMVICKKQNKVRVKGIEIVHEHLNSQSKCYWNWKGLKGLSLHISRKFRCSCMEYQVCLNAKLRYLLNARVECTLHSFESALWLCGR